MNNNKHLKSVKAGVIVAAVAVLIATVNLIVACTVGTSVFMWTGLAIFFSTITILFANLSSYQKKKKLLAGGAPEKIEKGID